MQDQLEQRLNELKSEFAVGQKTLDDLEAKQVNLRQTLLRISGAIQVLEELLHTELPPAAEDVDPQAQTAFATNGLD
ncbi:hypothetical protein [Candidatus Entotheonella palauensis]|uniref:hypothetical protein n=1 Tax=Candidatus Entotheonella palauensis TaxID=93172 RepID=UPI000B7D3195|nr:hypothetical protein [Candidatus Entotheonella palauensis]